MAQLVQQGQGLILFSLGQQHACQDDALEFVQLVEIALTVLASFLRPSVCLRDIPLSKPQTDSCRDCHATPELLIVFLRQSNGLLSCLHRSA